MKTAHSVLKKAIGITMSPIRRSAAKKKFKGLTTHKNQKICSIATALKDSLEERFSAEEQKMISLIEDRRANLLSSDKEISVVDFGAGSPSSNRSTQEMQRGVRSTASVSKVACASKPKFWSAMLLKLVRELQPSTCVELGSCVGISAAYQAAALKLNDAGDIITLEGSEEIARLARETLSSLDLENSSVVVGPFHETLNEVLESGRPIDFLFNDGHHDHDAVLDYFERSIPFLADSAVIIFDDISWSVGMRAAWVAIENDARVCATFDLRTIGIALIDKSAKTKEVFRMPL